MLLTQSVRQISLVALCVAYGLAQETHAVKRLADVRTIFVGSLGDAPGADLLRYKIQNRLIKAKSLALSTTPDQAEAILTGIGEVRNAEAIQNGVGEVRITSSSEEAQAQVRLIAKNERILWVAESPAKCFNSAEVIAAFGDGLTGRAPKAPRKCTSAEVADFLVKHLSKAVEKDRRAK